MRNLDSSVFSRQPGITEWVANYTAYDATGNIIGIGNAHFEAEEGRRDALWTSIKMDVHRDWNAARVELDQPLTKASRCIIN